MMSLRSKRTSIEYGCLPWNPCEFLHMTKSLDLNGRKLPGLTVFLRRLIYDEKKKKTLISRRRGIVARSVFCLCKTVL